MAKKKFVNRLVSAKQVPVELSQASKFVITRMANGDINKVNQGMVAQAAKARNLPLDALTTRLRKLGANI